jgi:hypothetical protein
MMDVSHDGYNDEDRLKKPRFWHRRLTGDISIYNRLRNQAWVSSFEERERGISLAVSDETGRHSIGYDGTWRDISPLDRAVGGRDVHTSTYAGPSRR